MICMLKSLTSLEKSDEPVNTAEIQFKTMTIT